MEHMEHVREHTKSMGHIPAPREASLTASLALAAVALALAALAFA